MGEINFSVMFDLLIAAYGVLMFFSANKMRQTGEPSPIILPRYELNRCIDKKGFIREVYPKTILFSIIIFAYGVIEIMNDLTLHISYIDSVSRVIFVIIFIWYVIILRKIRSTYIR